MKLTINHETVSYKDLRKVLKSIPANSEVLLTNSSITGVPKNPVILSFNKLDKKAMFSYTKKSMYVYDKKMKFVICSFNSFIGKHNVIHDNSLEKYLGLDKL